MGLLFPVGRWLESQLASASIGKRRKWPRRNLGVATTDRGVDEIPRDIHALRVRVRCDVDDDAVDKILDVTTALAWYWSTVEGVPEAENCHRRQDLDRRPSTACGHGQSWDRPIDEVANELRDASGISQVAPYALVGREDGAERAKRVMVRRAGGHEDVGLQGHNRPACEKPTNAVPEGSGRGANFGRSRECVALHPDRDTERDASTKSKLADPPRGIC